MQKRPPPPSVLKAPCMMKMLSLDTIEDCPQEWKNEGNAYDSFESAARASGMGATYRMAKELLMDPSLFDKTIWGKWPHRYLSSVEKMVKSCDRKWSKVMWLWMYEKYVNKKAKVSLITGYVDIEDGIGYEVQEHDVIWPFLQFMLENDYRFIHSWNTPNCHYHETYKNDPVAKWMVNGCLLRYPSVVLWMLKTRVDKYRALALSNLLKGKHDMLFNRFCAWFDKPTTCGLDNERVFSMWFDTPAKNAKEYYKNCPGYQVKDGGGLLYFDSLVEQNIFPLELFPRMVRMKEFGRAIILLNGGYKITTKNMVTEVCNTEFKELIYKAATTAPSSFAEYAIAKRDIELAKILIRPSDAVPSVMMWQFDMGFRLDNSEIINSLIKRKSFGEKRQLQIDVLTRALKEDVSYLGDIIDECDTETRTHCVRVSYALEVDYPLKKKHYRELCIKMCCSCPCHVLDAAFEDKRYDWLEYFVTNTRKYVCGYHTIMLMNNPRVHDIFVTLCKRRLATVTDEMFSSVLGKQDWELCRFMVAGNNVTLGPITDSTADRMAPGTIPADICSKIAKYVAIYHREEEWEREFAARQRDQEIMRHLWGDDSE